MMGIWTRVLAERQKLTGSDRAHSLDVECEREESRMAVKIFSSGT